MAVTPASNPDAKLMIVRTVINTQTRALYQSSQLTIRKKVHVAN